MPIGERVTKLEAEFKLLVIPMKQDVTDIKNDIREISSQMPLVKAHVNNNNGDRNKRKFDQKKYKVLVWSSIFGASATILYFVGKLGSMMITVGEILEAMPK